MLEEAVDVVGVSEAAPVVEPKSVGVVDTSGDWVGGEAMPEADGRTVGVTGVLGEVAVVVVREGETDLLIFGATVVPVFAGFTGAIAIGRGDGLGVGLGLSVGMGLGLSVGVGFKLRVGAVTAGESNAFNLSAFCDSVAVLLPCRALAVTLVFTNNAAAATAPASKSDVTKFQRGCTPIKRPRRNGSSINF